jgi:hypothetical protein
MASPSQLTMTEARIPIDISDQTTAIYASMEERERLFQEIDHLVALSNALIADWEARNGRFVRRGMMMLMDVLVVMVRELKKKIQRQTLSIDKAIAEFSVAAKENFDRMVKDLAS